MLAANPNAPPGCEGFIIDLEFPWMENVIGHSEVSKPAALKSGSTDTAMGVPAQRGASIHVSSYLSFRFRFAWLTLLLHQGTLQFMAIYILDRLERSKPVIHTVEHDIESFIWSMVYAILRKLLAAQDAPSDEKKSIDAIFRESFGRLDITKIYQSRMTLAPFLFLTGSESALLEANMSHGLFDFMFRLRGLMRRISDAVTQPKREVAQFKTYDVESDPRANSLTHTFFNAFLTEAIELIEEGSYN